MGFFFSRSSGRLVAPLPLPDGENGPGIYEGCMYGSMVAGAHGGKTSVIGKRCLGAGTTSRRRI